MLSQPGLVVAPSALPAGTSRFTYVHGAVSSPMCLSVAVFAACVGLGYAGVLGAALALVGVLAIGVHSARYRRVRAYIDSQARLHEKAKRERKRLKLLRPIGPLRIEHYNELRAIVEEVERINEPEAKRFELQELLDHYIRLAVDHRRCSDALQLANGAGAPPTMPAGDSPRSRRRREILQRRILHRDSCTQQMERLSDELAATDELIRLIAQRIASPELDGDLAHEIDRRLWELDEVDAALHQLSA
jgi:hypothetical protein